MKLSTAFPSQLRAETVHSALEESLVLTRVFATVLMGTRGRTVFGFGGAYLLEKSYAAIIFFAREAVDADRARELAPLSSALKAATTRLVDKGRFF